MTHSNDIGSQRIIGKYSGTAPGPLLIAVGGIHGNEPAGVEAIEILCTMLEREPESNPDFVFKGHLLGLRGNLEALAAGRRFIQRDMNRALLPEHVESLLNTDPQTLYHEDKEIYELVTCIKAEVEAMRPTSVVLLDLHTTTASGGIFVLASRNPESIRIGVEMHAPVITGFDDQILGTTMHYFTEEHFGREITTVVFESGQHEEPLSVNRAIAAMINCMRTIGCVRAEYVENRHDHLLREYSRDLPKVAILVDRFEVQNGMQFQMLPDFRNFDPVKAGELLAYANGTPIKAPKDGLLIMPKYQEQSEDGFFIVRPLEGY